MQLLSSNKAFGGWHKQYSHYSQSNHCDMRFAVFLPQVSTEKPVPVLYWLSGLTCTDENFMQKAGAFKAANELGIAIVAPDTSPRGKDVADADSYDLGQGAGFYVNASQAPWDAHYQMYSYVVDELPTLIETNFNVNLQRAISGHSMGGHGALMIALRNPSRYVSISAFSPIANPTNCAWGEKAFTAYLGNNRENWQQYDASLLMSKAKHKTPTLVSQGLADQFLIQQLKPEQLQQAAAGSDYPLTLEQHQDYDHSYYFIASFIEQHLNFHKRYLGE